MKSMYQLPQPAFDSALTEIIFETERLRGDLGTGTTPSALYLEIHALFNVVANVVSSRIEGNHTTVYEVLEAAPRAQRNEASEATREIHNLFGAANFVESLDPTHPLTHTFVRELHEKVTNGLTREGDPSPGAYRNHRVAITGSAHTPPDHVDVHAHMTDLLDFANKDFPLHQQMLQISLAHHRFVWIHPFSNGNGRVARLFTYAMLRRTIFASRGRSALNPSSVFGHDREAYIAALEAADSLSSAGDLEWSTFFARGIRDDLQRIVLLQDHDYVLDYLLVPALQDLAAGGAIDLETEAALSVVAKQGVAKAGELTEALPGSSSQRSRAIRKLIDADLLRTATDGPRFYQLNLTRGPLAVALVRRLNEVGLLPQMLVDD